MCISDLQGLAEVTKLVLQAINGIVISGKNSTTSGVFSIVAVGDVQADAAFVALGQVCSS
jgi:hypothetical protein